MNLRVLEHPYVFDHRVADCSKCELNAFREKSMCLSQRPTNWNGLMIVGEGPTVQESREKVPLSGRHGRMLEALLEQSGLKRAETYITHATLCLPPTHEKGVDEDFPSAVPSCKPRLLEEIAHYEPRVIITLGRASLLSLTGHSVTKTKRTPLNCQTCSGAMTLPWFACKHCTARVPLRGFMEPLLPCGACGHDAGGVESYDEAVSLLAKTKMKCPGCGGKKTIATEIELFQSGHRIDHVAGAVFDGSALGLDMVKYVIPSYHPSRILKKAETKAQRSTSGQFLFSPALEHFRKAARLLVSDRVWNFSHEVLPDAEAFRAWLDARRGCDYFTIDIETDNKEPQAVTDIRCVGINAVWRSNPQAPESSPIVLWTAGLDAQAPLVQELLRFLADPTLVKLGQNAILYDTQVLWLQWGADCQGFNEDTLYAHNATCPDEPHDLQHIALTHTDSPAWKPPKNKNGHQVWESNDELILYNARDVYNTGLSMAGLQTEMVAEEAINVYRLDIVKAHVARGMDRVGMPVDPEPYEALRTKAQISSVESLAKLRDLTRRPDFNPNAPKQLAEILYTPGGVCGFICKAFTDKGAQSTAAEALFSFRGHPVVDTLLEYRKWDKILGTYFGRFDEDGNQETGIAVDSDWRVRARWNPTGARTGRWSSSPNLMNWPEELRDVIGTTKLLRRMIVGADMPQAELRVIAALSGDENMIARCMNSDEDRKFQPDYDIHSYVASIAFPNFLDLPEWVDKVQPDGSTKRVSPRNPLRNAEKSVIYALNYGAAAPKILETISTDVRYNGPPMSIGMIERILAAIFKAFPGVRTYREKVIESAQRTGYVRDALINRRRVYPLRDVSPTEAANYAIQATVASMMDMSIIEFVHSLPPVDPSAFLMAQVHDALYAECDEDRAQPVADLMSAAMSQRIQLVPGAPFMDFPVKAKFGKVWSQL